MACPPFWKKEFWWSNLPSKVSLATTPPVEPVPEGLWPKGKYQQDASSFSELGDRLDRQARVRKHELAHGDTLTPAEAALKEVSAAMNRAASGTVVPPEPIVLEADAQVLSSEDPPRTQAVAIRASQSPPPAESVSIVAAERGIDLILHELLHEKKWLTPAERAKLDRAYQMEKHRAGLTQDPDPSKPMVFRHFVPPERPPAFHRMSATNRMWYCRMEELWTFRQEGAAKKALQGPPSSAASPPLQLPAPAKKPGRAGSRKRKKRS